MFLIISLLFVVVSVVVTTLILLSSCSKDDDVFKTDTIVGTWWWHKDIDTQKYLDFAQKNSVKEVYYCDYEINEDTANFIAEAKQRGIQVYALWGEKEWVNDFEGLDELIAKYRVYQTNNPSFKFEGIHLDVEPHQYDDFRKSEETTILYLEKYINMIDHVIANNPDIKFDFDIPAWYDTIITINQIEKPAYAHIMDKVNRVFVMSYRDNAESIISFAQDELDYAKSIQRQVFLCVEIDSDEEDKVSFKEECKKFLYQELHNLENLVDQEIGISIHYIETWYDLRNS